jgi:hypothetical protein
MSIRLSRRPSVVIQEPQSGLDLFFEELSKYASPEYQLRQREQDRADARLELSKRQQDEAESRYDDLVTQQEFENNLARQREDRLQSQFEMNEESNIRTNATNIVNEKISGLRLNDIIDTPIDSFLVGIENPKLRAAVKRNFSSIQNKAKSQYGAIMKRRDEFNTRYPDNPMSEVDAIDILGNNKAYQEYLSNYYFGKKGDLTEQQEKQVQYLTKQMANYQSRITDLETLQSSMEGVDKTTDIEELNLLNDKARKKIESILGLSKVVEGSLNPFDIDPTTIQTLPYDDNYLANFYDEDTPSYDVLFEDDATIADLAINQATQNAGEDVDVAIEDVVRPEDAPDDIPDWMFEPITEGVDDTRGGILSGLAGVQAAPEPKPKQQKDRDKIPPRLRNAEFGAKLLREKVDKLRRDTEISETAPNPQSRENIKKQLPKQIEEIKKIFSSIYDESDDTFFDDDSEFIKRRRARFPVLREKPLLYREFLGEDLINYIKSL